MWELDYEECWVPKNWCFWTVVLEKTLESPLDYKEIQPVHPKGDQSWVFIGRTDVEAETPILWPPDAKSWLIRKDPDARKDWGQEEKGMTEDEMVGWLHRLNGHEFEQAPGVGDGQGGLACCSPWCLKESNTTERLNWTGPGFCCKNTYIAWLLPFLFRTDPQSSLRDYLLGLSLQYVCQIKHKSLTFKLCFFPVNSTNCSVCKGKLKAVGNCAFCDIDDQLWPVDQI